MGPRAGRSLILLAAITFVAVQSGFAEPGVDELIAKAQPLDRALKATQALQIYQQAERLEPDNVEVLLAIARQYRHIMADTGNRGEKLRILDRAMDYSRRAVALDPGNAETHLSVAITYGKRTPLEGNKERLETSRLLKSEVEKTLRLDPDNDTAWHLLGRWHETYAELSGVKRAMAELIYGELPKSTPEDAVRCFQKAIASNPNRSMHYIELGRSYALMGHDADARKFIEKGLSMPDREKDDPDTKQRGRETLKTLR